MKNRKTVYLIDGSAIAYRSYFAMIRNRLTNSTGFPTGAIFAFVNSLRKLINDQKPDYIGIVFDAPEKTFRHEIYPEYKATREAMPEELVSQLPYMFKIVEAMHIPVLLKPGFEADDIIGTLAKRTCKADLETFMVTGDKDFMQLLEEGIQVYKPATGKKGIEIISADDVQAKLGVAPEQIPDYLGLIGDSSDNIPGIKGVGPAKARPLLQQFGTLEKLLENCDKIDNKRIRKLIAEGAKQALFSKRLATIKTDVPIDIELDQLRLQSVDKESLTRLYDELEFYSFIKELNPGENKKTEKDYRTVDNPDDLKQIIRSIKNVDLLSIDLETTSTDPMRAEIVGISMSWQADQGVYIPLRAPRQQQTIFEKEDGDRTLKLLKPILEDASVPKCGQNLKYDMLILERKGIQLQGLEFDTMVAAFLIQPDARSYKLDKLSQQYLNYSMQPIEDLIGSGKNQKCMDEVPLDKVSFYAAEDADVARQLVPIFRSKLQEDQLQEVFEEIELPLIPVLMTMEENGIFLDIDFLKEMSRDLSKQLDSVARDIYKAAGEEFNINSPKQLAEILFDKLGLSGGRKRSTAVHVLEKLTDRHPLPGLVLDYRTLMKLQSTYVDALPALVNAATGRVHSSFNQTVASTGRLSSSDPNFQNIPIRTDIGREIRKAFIPQKKGWKLLSADYSQVELRIMAHLSKDPELIRAFQEDVDIHTRTAARVFGVKEQDVLPEMRRVAKVVNFGIMYGAGAYRLSEELKISMEEAQGIIDQYFKTYPGINNYIISTLESARREKYVKTLSGRRRYVHDIDSQNSNVRSAVERIAINMPIQGTAADLIKIAMIRIHERLKKEQLAALMILQIHDELLFETSSEALPKLRQIVVDEMENALQLDIPLKVDVGVGKTWYEAH